MPEIKQLKNNTSLLVLSACETGIGQIVKGEGVFGLGRAFFIAGTHILASYWKVSDQSTQQLISYFYNFMLSENKTFATSLQLAKKNLIQSYNFSHPYYWSPFVLIKG